MGQFFSWVSRAYVGGASDAEDLGELVDLSVAAEERLAEVELCEGAAAGPDVDGFAVEGSSEEYFRGAVPTGDDALGHLDVGLAVVAGEAEVRELAVAFAVDEDVLRLDVLGERRLRGAAPTGGAGVRPRGGFGGRCRRRRTRS